jgi:hypothetical protein
VKTKTLWNLFTIAIIGFALLLAVVSGVPFKTQRITLKSGTLLPVLVTAYLSIFIILIAGSHLKSMKQMRIRAIWTAVIIISIIAPILAYINISVSFVLVGALFFGSIILACFYVHACPNCGSKDVTCTKTACTCNKCGQSFENRETAIPYKIIKTKID